MKILIASDIHGSKKYAHELKNAVIREMPDRICLLGDYYYHGPRNPLTEDYDPMGVSKILNTMKDDIVAVRGNCDSDIDCEISAFPIHKNACVPLSEGRSVYLTHGDVFNEDNLPPLKPGDILCCGHFHMPYVKFVGNNVVINPGSISLPKNGVHTYALLTEYTVTIFDTDGNAFMEYSLV